MVSDSTITSQDVQDGTLTGADVQDASLTGGDVQDASLTGADLQDGSVATADLADAAATTAKLADGSVTTAKLADAGVTAAKLASSAVTTAKVADASITRAKLGESVISLSDAQATQNGTYKDFSGIPSWARRVVLLLYGVSTNGASDILIQLGGASPVTSGYINGQSTFAWGSGILNTTSTAGIPIYNNSATYVWSGRVVMELLEPGLNNWVVTATLNNTVTSPAMVISSGIAALGANVLAMVRITTASGTPALDAGYASISWE